MQGEGQFFDDIRRHGMGYVHFVRSPYAHARIVSIDVSAALALDDVYGTITGDEVAIQTDPFFEMSTAPGNAIKDYALAVGKVRHMGEPVAAVCAATRELARDAAELVEVEYEELPVLVDGEEALKRRDDPPRRRGLERRLVGSLRLGRRRRCARRGRPRRQDREAPLPPLLLDAARVRGRARRVRPGDGRSGRSSATTRCPESGRSGWRRHSASGSTSCASSPATSAAASATRSPAPVVRRALPAGAEARPPGPVDREAHRPAHRPTRTATSGRSSTSRWP